MKPLIVCALVSTLILTACAGQPVDPQTEQSPSYQAGYADGCATAAARSRVYDRSLTRDETAYAEDDRYRRGWNVGYRSCGSRATQKDPDTEPAADWKKSGPLN